ncbi:MAG: hypothetical protein IJV04_04515 [Lachnospiraceae bacterium]|nr:hypothetical protein [Lachnospiraceae bacterium]
MDKIRVYNPRKYDIGLVLQSGMERVIHPGSFTPMSRDDIEYAASMAPALFEGEKQLRLEDHALAVQLGFVQDESEPVFDAEEIRKKLGMRNPQVKAWLESIQEGYLLDAVCDVAATMDLPASKLQLLQDRMPEREFLKAE